MSAARRPDVAAFAWPVARPPEKMFCENWRPSTHWFSAPKPTLLKSMPPPAGGHVCAASSAACRSAGVAVAEACGEHSDSTDGPVVVSGPPLEKPENCERSVRAYEAVALICGRNWLRAIIC